MTSLVSLIVLYKDLVWATATLPAFLLPIVSDALLVFKPLVLPSAIVPFFKGASPVSNVGSNCSRTLLIVLRSLPRLEAVSLMLPVFL